MVADVSGRDRPEPEIGVLYSAQRERQAQPEVSHPRVIQIQHHERTRGDLLATFNDGKPWTPIYQSGDNGDTWKLITEVPWLRSQAYLYELPQPVAEFPAGTVLIAGLDARADSTFLRVAYSHTGGRSWQPLGTIVEGGAPVYNEAQRFGYSSESPVWLPVLSVDREGRLVAYYVDERHKAEGYNQLIAHKVSEDGGRTWGEERFTVAIPDGLTRPGMPNVTRLPNDEYFLAYEVLNLPGHLLEPRTNPVFFRLSEDGIDFGDPEDVGMIVQDAWRQCLVKALKCG